MDSPPISDLTFVFRSTDGLLIDGPREWEPAFLQIDVPPDDWRMVAIRIQGEEINARVEKRFGEEAVLAEWDRRGTGNYQLDVSIGDAAVRHTISIRPRKISEEALRILIEDVEKRLPTSIALGLDRRGGRQGLAIQPRDESTLAQEVTRLRRAILGVEGRRPGLASTLKKLADDPHRILERINPWVRRTMARRPLPSAFGAALIKGANLDEEGRLRRVVDQRVEHTVDVYENRLVLMYYQQVATRLRIVSGIAGAQSNAELGEELFALRGVLDTARRTAMFLDDVTLVQYLPLRLTMVLLRRPAYRSALEGYLEFNRSPEIRLRDDALDAPLENLPSLYQTWATLDVIDVFLAVAEELGYRVLSERLLARRTGELFVEVLPDGRAALVIHNPAAGATAKLYPERHFGSGGQIFSVSYGQRPDITIEMIHSDGDTELLLLDPKYKLDSEERGIPGADGRPKKVDIDKMHAYRDAIRDRSNRRITRYAGILYPGPCMSFGADVGAVQALPGNAEEGRDRLHELLTDFLDTSRNVQAASDGQSLQVG